MQYEMRLSERGPESRVYPAHDGKRKTSLLRERDGSRVLPGTRESLGMMQYLRNVDWAKTPEVRSPVYDGQQIV